MESSEDALTAALKCKKLPAAELLVKRGAPRKKLDDWKAKQEELQPKSEKTNAAKTTGTPTTPASGENADADEEPAPPSLAERIENGDMSVLNELEDVHAPLDEKRQRRPIHHARDVAMCEALVELGAKLKGPKAKDRYGNLPIHLAAAQGKAEVVKWMLDQKVNVNAKGSGGETPIFRAGSAATLRVLMNAGADPAKAIKGSTPLHAAARRGLTECILLLVGAGADLNAFDKKDPPGTPLYRAVESGRAEATRTLLELGADMLRVKGKETLLHKAAGRGVLGVVEALLAAGADPNAENEAGQKPELDAWKPAAPQVEFRPVRGTPSPGFDEWVTPSRDPGRIPCSPNRLPGQHCEIPLRVRNVRPFYIMDESRKSETLMDGLWELANQVLTYAEHSDVPRDVKKLLKRTSRRLDGLLETDGPCVALESLNAHASK